MSEPYEINRVKREVIEHKLLTALEEGGIAALLSKQDLEDLLYCCDWTLSDLTRGQARLAKRLTNLRDGFEQLRKEAFP
jgi:hypothetical protein